MKPFHLLLASAVILSSCATGTVLESPATDGFELDPDESFLDAAEDAGFQTLEEDDYHIHSGSDDDFIYIIAEVRSRAMQQRIEDYGFQIALETDDNWLGLTYPMGKVEALRDFQDAAVGYILDPSWEQMPDNQSTMDQAEEDFRNNALLSQDSEETPAQISLSELQAQNVYTEFQEIDGFYTIAYRIPLQAARSQQFSPDVESGESISVSVSINPPSAEDLTGEELTGAGSDMGGGGNMMGGGQQQQQDQQQEEQSMADRVDRVLGSDYSNSFQIQLP